jgi:hypothetical protein
MPRNLRTTKSDRNPIDPRGQLRGSQNQSTSWGAQGDGSNHPVTYGGVDRPSRRRKPRRL